MSMTREEAKEILENWNLCHYTPSREAAEMVISALDPLEIISALRPVSRKQVEKVWEKCQHSRVCGTCKVCVSGRYQQANFCAVCGAPMTDEAVEMVMERLEAPHDASN